MHKYLRAIGFSKIKSRSQLESIYQDALANPTKKVATLINADTTLIQIDKDFGENFGLSLIGEIDANGQLSIEHYFPYVKPYVLTTLNDEIKVEKHCDKESYAGIIDDMRMSIIFFVLNIADYARLQWFNKKKSLNIALLSGLSTEAKILLPVQKTMKDIKYERKKKKEEEKYFNNAKNGDSDAIEHLYMKDYDLRNSINERTYNEDLFSIVDTSMVPYGVNCECYEVLGTIVEYESFKNSISDELIYVITIKCNEYIITVAINSTDLIGTPESGRRFKGVIWLQGYLAIQ